MLKSLILLAALISVAFAVESERSLNEEFAADCLFAHNLYRKLHGVPSLVLSPRLSELAITRAQELAELEELNVKQNKFHGQTLGETVGSVGGFSHYNGISATQLWYSVVSKFDEEGELSSEGASFTQIVWKSTRQVGFGIARSKSGKFFFVAEYYPSGNIRHQYEDNVFQLTDEELVKPLDCPVTVHSNTTRIRVPVTNQVKVPVDTEVVPVKPPKKVVPIVDDEVTKIVSAKKTTTTATTLAVDEEEEEPVVTRPTKTEGHVTTPDADLEEDAVTEVSRVKKPVKTTVRPVEDEVEVTTVHRDVITLPTLTDYDYPVPTVKKTTKPTVTTTTVSVDEEETTVAVPVKKVTTTTVAPEEDSVEVVDETTTTVTTTKVIKTTTGKVTPSVDDEEETIVPSVTKGSKVVVETTTKVVKVVDGEETETVTVASKDVVKKVNEVVDVKKVEDEVVVKKEKDDAVVAEKVVPAKRQHKAEKTAKSKKDAIEG